MLLLCIFAVEFLATMWGKDLSLRGHWELLVDFVSSALFQWSEWSLSLVLEMCTLLKQGNAVINFFLTFLCNAPNYSICKSVHLTDGF